MNPTIAFRNCWTLFSYNPDHGQPARRAVDQVFLYAAYLGCVHQVDAVFSKLGFGWVVHSSLILEGDFRRPALAILPPTASPDMVNLQPWLFLSIVDDLEVWLYWKRPETPKEFEMDPIIVIVPLFWVFASLR